MPRQASSSSSLLISQSTPESAYLSAPQPQFHDRGSDNEDINSSCKGTEKGSVHEDRTASPVSVRNRNSDGDERPISSMCAADARFILDSGSSVHATGNVSIFNIDHLSDDYYRRRDGKVLPVISVGSIAAGTKDGNGFRLSGVQYVPQLGPGLTLVSVQQLTASGFLVMFCGVFCYITDVNEGGIIIGKGLLNEDDGFYHLEFLRVPAPGVFQQEGKMGAAVS